MNIPFYTIIPCCPELGTATNYFNIPGSVVVDGVYVYNGVTTIVNGVTFETGFCYTIDYVGDSITNYNDAPSSVTFEQIKQCTDESCADCSTLNPYAFDVYACCDSDVVVTINIDGAPTISNSVYIYNGIDTIVIGGVAFIPGQCYHINYSGLSVEAAGPAFSEFTFNSKICASKTCPECPKVQEYLLFVSCCDDTNKLYFGMPFGGFISGVYSYIAAPISGLENICYSVTIGTVGDEAVPDAPAYDALPVAPIFSEDVTYNTLSNSTTECSFYAEECPACSSPCYTLYSCDGLYFNTTVNLEAYVGTFITVYDAFGPIKGTWYVLVNEGDCANAVDDIAVDNPTADPCKCICYEVIGNAKQIIYIDCVTGELKKLFGSAKFCSYVYPFVSGNAGEYQVIEGDNCIDNACPIKCYELTECTTGEIITSQSQSLSQYFATGEVIELVGHPGCWQVNSDTAQDCSCPIDVTVTVVHRDCPTCLGITAYKLTNCQNASDIKYTYDDLSEYVDQTLRTDCGCYTVELIDFQPTSTSPIVIISSFNNCVECLRIYYELTDCNRVEPSVYTYTDLSGYAGQVINIKGCDTCFTIAETDTPINPLTVTVTNSFLDCIACTPPLPCLCNRMTNYSTEDQDYQYLNCNDETVNLKLAAGESSGKICLKTWLLDHPDTDNLEVFGECTDLQDPKFTWECPETRPKRKIKPGYSVPTCDIEKWEKITCKSSEILYKEVMRLRYGISNCCPDEDDKWLIKKELIDLAALVDPDYICTPVQSCGCAPSSCGCGCSSTLKTCSSQ